MRIGIIGYGLRIAHIFNKMLEFELGVELTAVCDINRDRAKKRLEENKLDHSKIVFYEDADEMLDREELDGVMIGTRCSLHTTMAVKVLSRDIPLFIEKPVATNMKDLTTLNDAYRKSKSKVVVSFPLRVSPMLTFVKEIIDSGRIGMVEHVQAINNVPYGGVYYHSWYRDESETGGLFLQKATHDLDYINYLLDIKPVEVCAMVSKQVYKGDKPEGLKCSDCDQYETCTESPFYIKHMSYDEPHGDMCSFAKDTGNEDSGSVIIRYETGMHAVYSQNFFIKKEAAARAARLMGSKGTLEFDWYRNEVKVYMHHVSVVETHKFDSKSMEHFGGDSILAYNFINVIRGKEDSKSPLEAGINSALLCLTAKESAETRAYKKVEMFI